MSWPLVHERDDGIRPAGDPNACFYCNQKVGRPHLLDCVIVTKRVLMRIVSSDGRLTGTWEFDAPHGFSAETIEFMKNESSWCVNNVLRSPAREEIVWDQPNAWEILDTERERRACLCDMLRFEFVRVVDDTPHREILTDA